MIKKGSFSLGRQPVNASRDSTICRTTPVTMPRGSTANNSSVSGATRAASRSPPPRPADLDSLLTTPSRDSLDQADFASINLSPLPPQTPKAKTRTWPTFSWGGEVFAGVISTASLIALVVILAMQDGRPLSTWTFTFSLNTVASILSTIFKTPLAYLVGSSVDQIKWIRFTKKDGTLTTFASIDEAGRGPLGCASLLRLLGFGWVHLPHFSTFTRAIQ